MESYTYQDLSRLEKSVANAGTTLYTVANKLYEVERNLDDTSIEDVDDLCVMELLDTMTEVKKIEENLRKDIQEVQKLQVEVSTSMRIELRKMQNTFVVLKKRIELAANAQN